VLTIKVCELLEKLMMRPVAPLDKPMIFVGSVLYQSDENRAAHAETAALEAVSQEREEENARKLGEFIRNSQQTFKTSLDNHEVKAMEWKTVPSKYHIGRRQPPACRPHRSISAACRQDTSYFAPIDLNYPKDFDLFPSAQRSVLAQAAQRTCSPDGSLATTTVPSRAASSFATTGTDEWMFASLDEQIRQKLLDAEELEVEHYLHTSLGMYMEDADRNCSVRPSTTLPASISGYDSSLLSARPKTTPGGRRAAAPVRDRSPPGNRNAVLLTCGAAPTSPRVTSR
jgi:hypothetical protein